MKVTPSVFIGIALAVIVIVLGLALYVVTKTPSTVITSAVSPSQRVDGMRGGYATGSIEVLNDDGFTLTLQDGTTKDIQLSATTTIQNYSGASTTPVTITSDQLSVGEQVSVIGSPNDDGSITARVVRTGVLQTRGNASPSMHP